MSATALPLLPYASFADLQDTVITTLNDDIKTLLDSAHLPAPLADACHYVMTANGKRVRPLLVAASFLSATDAHNTLGYHARFDMCRRAMLATELLHTYSLVHDDLPCMDDDELRRGQPTAHIAFDEATALLAGDVLQTLAFEALSAELPGFAPFDGGIASALMAVFAPRARRMVAGQMLDMNAEAADDITQSELEAIHRDKTGALIEAAMLMGGICAGAPAPTRMALQDCAASIGLAFQVQDDILDATISTDELGKPAGSDEKLDKSTYVKLMGVTDAKQYAQALFDDGRAALLGVIEAAGTSDLTHRAALFDVINWLWSRKK